MAPASQEHWEKRIRSRAQLYLFVLELFYRTGIFDPEKVICNQALLLVAVESYFRDLERMKEFHGIEYADAHKRAGFTFRWLCKLKPLQIFLPEEIKALDKKLLLANEIWAFFCAISHLKLEHLSPEAANHIIYSGLYRDMKGEEWALLMYFLEHFNF
jgi:hypothetical protein